MTVAERADIQIRVWGIPAPQGSKAVRGYVNGRAILGEASKAVAPWRVDVRAACQNQYTGPALSCPVSLCATFLFARPKAHFGTGRNAERLKASAPRYLTSVRHGDLDKLIRSTCDGLSISAGGTLLEDDSLIVQVMADKRYCEEGELPGAYLTVCPLVHE